MSRGHAQWRRAGQCSLAALLSLPGDLAALEQRVEGGGPEAGFVVVVIGRGSLSVEADQAVVAASVVAAVAVEARSAAGGRG